MFTPAVHPGREPDGLVMLTLASTYDGNEYALAFVACAVSSIAALAMSGYLRDLHPGSVDAPPRFSRLRLAVKTFPVVHALLLVVQFKLTALLGLGPHRPSDATESLAMIWFLGVPATLATIPTAVALAAAWRCRSVGWLAVGTTAALSIATGAAAELWAVSPLLLWIFAAPVVWLAVVCLALSFLRPPDWSGGHHRPDDCPACGYSTAGLKQAVCPECGGSLRLGQSASTRSDP